MKDEFNQPSEYQNSVEYRQDKEKFSDGEEFVPNNRKENTSGKKASKIRKMVYLVTAALTTMAVINAADPEFSILTGIGMATESEPDSPANNGNGGGNNNSGGNNGGNNGSTDAVVEFPKLDNLEPNGEVPGYGVINEDYVYLVIDGETRYLHAGLAYKNIGIQEEELVGAIYDPINNILTLRDFEAEQLNVNMMGNGFTVRLEGENHIKEILVWGFYYGGSITFTGDGKLIASGDGRSRIGLVLEAENSNSCIMVEAGVTLDISGEVGAILVNNTSEKKGLYCSELLKYTGGKWETIDSTDGYKSYTMLNDEGTYATHIVIEAK